MNVLAIRIHELDDGFRPRIIAHFREYDGFCFVVREVKAARPHYQAIVRVSFKRGACDARITKSFPECVGNRCKSITTLKDDGSDMVRYLCKGNREGELPDVVFTCGIEVTPDWIKGQHDEFYRINKSLKERHKSKAVVEIVYDRCKSLSREGRQEEVCRHVIEELKDRGSGINLFYVRGIYNAVMLRLDAGFQESFIQEVLSKY